MMSKVHEILSQVRPEFDFSQSSDFLDDGMLDSFDLITVVSELDRTYDISIDGLDVIPENFSSTEKIEALIQRYGVAP